MRKISIYNPSGQFIKLMKLAKCFNLKNSKNFSSRFIIFDCILNNIEILFLHSGNHKSLIN